LNSPPAATSVSAATLVVPSSGAMARLRADREYSPHNSATLYSRGSYLQFPMAPVVKNVGLAPAPRAPQTGSPTALLNKTATS